MVDSTKQNVKHTPGPWEIDKSTSSQGHDIYNSGEKSELLASVYPMKHDGQYMSWKANARLIAAAPEMAQMLLEELEDLDCWLRDESVSDDTKSAMLIREDKIQLLLRKAGLGGS